MINPLELDLLANKIKQWGYDLGFQQVGICSIDLSSEEFRLQEWLDKKYHGQMHWMEKHHTLRLHPELLLPETLRVISVRMDYLPPNAKFAHTLENNLLGYISRYAVGRDYHKLMRQQLKKLGEQIKTFCCNLNYRPFVDSAPVLEKPLAEKAGLGWIGKHSLLINQHAGSWFFIGELFVNIPLPVDRPQENLCKNCVSCLKTCPTGAIIKPYFLDATRCISYLTIEYDGIIPEAFRSLIGNRIYGCDDCQLVCPWNRYAHITQQHDFHSRNNLTAPELTLLFAWSEEQFLHYFAGSAIRRIGYLKWLRNIAIALGNAPYHANIIEQLTTKLGLSPQLDEHLTWAITQQQRKQTSSPGSPLNCDLTRKKNRLITTIKKGLPRDA